MSPCSLSFHTAPRRSPRRTPWLPWTGGNSARDRQRILRPSLPLRGRGVGGKGVSSPSHSRSTALPRSGGERRKKPLYSEARRGEDRTTATSIETVNGQSEHCRRVAPVSAARL